MTSPVTTADETTPESVRAIARGVDALLEECRSVGAAVDSGDWYRQVLDGAQPGVCPAVGRGRARGASTRRGPGWKRIGRRAMGVLQQGRALCALVGQLGMGRRLVVTGPAVLSRQPQLESPRSQLLVSRGDRLHGFWWKPIQRPVDAAGMSLRYDGTRNFSRTLVVAGPVDAIADRRRAGRRQFIAGAPDVVGTEPDAPIPGPGRPFAAGSGDD